MKWVCTSITPGKPSEDQISRTSAASSSSVIAHPRLVRQAAGNTFSISAATRAADQEDQYVGSRRLLGLRRLPCPAVLRPAVPGGRAAATPGGRLGLRPGQPDAAAGPPLAGRGGRGGGQLSGDGRRGA